MVGVVRALQPHFSRVETSNFTLGRHPLGAWRDGLSVPLDNARLHSLKNDWDLLHINTSMRPHAVFRDGILLATWGRRPSIVTFHGWSDGLWSRFAASAVLRRWFVAAYGGRPIIALAERFRDGLEALGLDRRDIEVIGPAFDGSLMGSGTNAEERENTRIVYLGRLVREKGLFELLEAFARLADGAELILVGSGPAGAAIEDWISTHGMAGRVRLTGRLEGVDKVCVLQSASIFVLPSYTEGLPVAMLEAMAAGLAVVVTDVGGISEIVAHGRNGWLLAEASEVGVALAEALADPRKCSEMGARNRLAARPFEAAAIARQVEDLYLHELGER